MVSMGLEWRQSWNGINRFGMEAELEWYQWVWNGGRVGMVSMGLEWKLTDLELDNAVC